MLGVSAGVACRLYLYAPWLLHNRLIALGVQGLESDLTQMPKSKAIGLVAAGEMCG